MARTPITLARTAAVALLPIAALSTAPSVASAETCVMLPPGRPSEGPAAPAEAQAAAVAAVSRELTRDDVTVIPTEDAQRRLHGEPFAGCNALECGGEVVRSLGVDYAVLVTVWAPRGTPTSVVVTVIGAGDSAAGDAPVEGGDVSAAARSALTIARQRWQTAHMGFLNVTSDPPGASVEVDGRLIGQTPVRYLVPAGRRTVRVVLDGYEPVEEQVEVEPTREHPLEVALTESRETEPSSPATRSEPHVANWIVGGALIAGGLGALVMPVATLAAHGHCVDREGLPGEEWCRSEVRFGTASGVLLGVGAAALIGGAVFLIAQPITVTTSVGPGSARLELRGTF